MSSKVIGLDRLNRKLALLPIAARRRIREAMQQGADEIVATMRALVPTDSGDLKNSIDWTWGSAPKGALTIATVRGQGMRITGSENTITIYAGNADAYFFITRASWNSVRQRTLLAACSRAQRYRQSPHRHSSL
jgi:hypothetical protein